MTQKGIVLTLARNELTGLVADISDEIIDHPELGANQTRVSNNKPRVIPEPGKQPKTVKDED